MKSEYRQDPAGEQTDTLLMYHQLADWWPLVSAPQDYAEEAAFISGVFKAAVVGPLKTLLELGSGGGNNASFLKKEFDLTLVDRSADMLAVSRKQNPEANHIQGDMRSVNLQHTFDAVLIHDAIMYLTREVDLAAAIQTARRHCRRGGAVLLVPDCVRETFIPETRHSGHDGEGRSLRYLEWSYDPDPQDDTFITEYVYLLRDESGPSRVLHEQHIEGLFPRQVWLELMAAAGLEGHVIPDNFNREVFLGKVPADSG